MIRARVRGAPAVRGEEEGADSNLIMRTQDNLGYLGSMMRQNPAAAPPAISPAAKRATIAPLPIPSDATEEQLIELWLHGKSPNTIRAYDQDIAAFRAFIGKPIRLTYLGDLARRDASRERPRRAPAGSSA
jgi:hypothetical protein